MERIPFNIEFRPQIESGEYKVETKSGNPIRVLAWDLPYDFPIATAEFTKDNRVIVESYSVDGWVGYGEKENNLVIVTSEPDLTEFEKALSDTIGYAISQSVVEPSYETYKFVKDWSKRLLDAAKKELCKDCPEKQCKDYRYEGPTPHTWFPSCYHGGPCTNPMHDCINCPRQSTNGINTATGTSTAKLEG